VIIYTDYFTHPFSEEEEKISVIFPDLGNLATFGDNVANAMCMAVDACGQYLFTAKTNKVTYFISLIIFIRNGII